MTSELKQKTPESWTIQLCGLIVPNSLGGAGWARWGQGDGTAVKSTEVKRDRWGFAVSPQHLLCDTGEGT